MTPLKKQLAVTGLYLGSWSYSAVFLKYLGVPMESLIWILGLQAAGFLFFSIATIISKIAP